MNRDDIDFGGLAQMREAPGINDDPMAAEREAYLTARRVPRHTEGGASAPPDASIELARKTAPDAPRSAQPLPHTTPPPQPDYGIRVVASDDNRELFLSLYNIPIPPEVGMKLAAALLDASIRLMDRRAAVIREREASHNATNRP